MTCKACWLYLSHRSQSGLSFTSFFLYFPREHRLEAKPLFIVNGHNYSGREQYIFPAFLPHMVRQGPTYPWLTLNSRSSHFHLPNARILSTLHRPSLCGEGSHGFGHSKQAVFHLSYIPHPPWVYAHLNLWLHCPSLP